MDPQRLVEDKPAATVVREKGSSGLVWIAQFHEKPAGLVTVVMSAAGTREPTQLFAQMHELPHAHLHCLKVVMNHGVCAIGRLRPFVVDALEQQPNLIEPQIERSAVAYEDQSGDVRLAIGAVIVFQAPCGREKSDFFVVADGFRRMLRLRGKLTDFHGSGSYCRFNANIIAKRT